MKQVQDEDEEKEQQIATQMSLMFFELVFRCFLYLFIFPVVHVASATRAAHFWLL